jgi:tRNA nucleotidyltransferase/poly(A) polymerase
VSTVGEEYPQEQSRCRELIERYRAIGPAGTFAALAITEVLREADEAAIGGDPVRILRAFKAMQGCE